MKEYELEFVYRVHFFVVFKNIEFYFISYIENLKYIYLKVLCSLDDTLLLIYKFRIARFEPIIHNL